MALVACTECGNNVSTEAKACPSCGAPVVKPKPPKKRSLVWPLLGVMTVAGIVGAELAKTSTAPQTPAQKKEDEARAKRIVIARMAAAQLKTSMKDPESFELKSAVVHTDGAACFKYRAKNSFGATLPAEATMTPAGGLLTSESGNRFVTAWNKHCTSAGGDEVASLLKRSLSRE